MNLECRVLEVAARGHKVLPDCRHLLQLGHLVRVFRDKFVNKLVNSSVGFGG